MGSKSQARKYNERLAATRLAAGAKALAEQETKAKMESPHSEAVLTPKELKALGYKRTLLGWRKK